jgi:hypothetical protein
MNYNRNSIIIGFFIGIIVTTGFGTYLVYSKISNLENQLDEVKQQINNITIGFTEFEIAERYYLLESLCWSSQSQPCLFTRLYLKENQTIEWMFKQAPHKIYPATFTKVSKLELKEKFNEITLEKMQAHSEAILPITKIFSLPDRREIYITYITGEVLFFEVFWCAYE